MLRDRVVAELLRRLPTLRHQVGDSDQPFVTIPAPSPLLGAITIHDDKGEATVYAGDLTHGHFYPFGHQLSLEARESWIAEAVVAFLEDVVADRILFWAKADRRGGGWTHLDPVVAPDAPGEILTVWSGPWPLASRSQRNAG